MPLSKVNLSEENPFSRIKIRHLILWFFIFAFGVVIQVLMIAAIINRDFSFKNFQFDDLDPILNRSLDILIILLMTAWLWRQCKLVGINTKYLIGEVPKNYQWLSLFGLILATELFYRGAWRFLYYLLSFIAPDWVENIINQSINDINKGLFAMASKSFSLPLYIILAVIISWGIGTAIYIFIFQGIILHRLSFKWGIRKSIIALVLFFVMGSYPYIISAAIFVLFLTILYLKTRTLIIPTIAIILDDIISYPLNYLLITYWYSNTNNVLERFREGIGLWILLFVIPAPWVIGFIYKNFPKKNAPLPYFANQQQARYRESE